MGNIIIQRNRGRKTITKKKGINSEKIKSFLKNARKTNVRSGSLKKISKNMWGK